MTTFADPHERDALTESAARSRVSLLLGDKQWHLATEITSPQHGGSEGLRRLRELRAHGWKIEMCRVAGGTQRQYRLVSVGLPAGKRKLTPPSKVAVKALLDETRAIHKNTPLSPEAVKALQWLKERFGISNPKDTTS